ncbi:MAG: DUF6089 family protein [Saprospiraceae bacterium]|nr:DUF6089 family protein [Saprospiraceae bacterium]
MNVYKWLWFSGLFLLLHTPALAQMKGWEAGGWLGISNYFGDLNTNFRFNRTSWSAGAGARYNFNDRLALKMAANAGHISAFDSDSDNAFELRRNLSFESMVVDLSAQFEFNFLPYTHGHRENLFTPYLFGGPAVFFFNPQAELDGETYNLREYGTEGQFKGEEYNTTQAALVYGFGFKTDLSYRLSLNIELSARKIFTDYLDDVSGVYADIRDIESQRGEIAARLADRSVEPMIGEPGRQRGNGKTNDTYVFLQAGVMYYFGQIRCPSYSK